MKLARRNLVSFSKSQAMQVLQNFEINYPHRQPRVSSIYLKDLRVYTINYVVQVLFLNDDDAMSVTIPGFPLISKIDENNKKKTGIVRHIFSRICCSPITMTFRNFPVVSDLYPTWLTILYITSRQILAQYPR